MLGLPLAYFLIKIVFLYYCHIYIHKILSLCVFKKKCGVFTLLELWLVSGSDGGNVAVAGTVWKLQKQRPSCFFCMVALKLGHTQTLLYFVPSICCVFNKPFNFLHIIFIKNYICFFFLQMCFRFFFFNLINIKNCLLISDFFCIPFLAIELSTLTWHVIVLWKTYQRIFKGKSKT